MKKIITKFILLSLSQWGILCLLLCLYSFLFPVKRPDISFGIAVSYYLKIFFPIILLIWNLISLTIRRRMPKVILYILLIAITLIYWIGGLAHYPYRISFILFSSIGIVLAGYYYISKISNRSESFNE